MSRFIIGSFLIMGWAFYELSGGADFQPRKMAQPAGTPEMQLVAGHSAIVPDPVKIATVIQAPEITQVNRAEPAVSEAAPVRATLTLAPATEPGAQPATLTLASLEGLGTQIATQPADVTNPQPAPVAAAPEPAPLDIRAISGSRVNMRQGPGTDHGILTSLVRGVQVEVLEESANGWLRLRPLDGGPEGWMSAQFVTNANR